MTSQDLKEVAIMIGVPGAGKSTLVKNLIDEASGSGKAIAVHSTDSYFIKNGAYIFNPGKLGEYHALNYKAFSESVYKGIDFIIVDNTNLVRAHRLAYAELARNIGYKISYHVAGKFNDEAYKVYAKRNQHGVPLESIVRMGRKFNPILEKEIAEFDRVQFYDTL